MRGWYQSLKTFCLQDFLSAGDRLRDRIFFLPQYNPAWKAADCRKPADIPGTAVPDIRRFLFFTEPFSCAILPILCAKYWQNPFRFERHINSNVEAERKYQKFHAILYQSFVLKYRHVFSRYLLTGRILLFSGTWRYRNQQ